MIAISTEDFLWYLDQAVDQMLSILQQLGDGTASRRPGLPGANSPCAILTHCLGVMEFWGGEVIAGRAIERDRDAEFRAEGPVADLIRRAGEARRQLATDIADLESLAAPRRAADRGEGDLPIWKTNGGVLLHIFEELYQHLGQMELSRDILVSGGAGGQVPDQ